LLKYDNNGSDDDYCSDYDYDIQESLPSDEAETLAASLPANKLGVCNQHNNRRFRYLRIDVKEKMTTQN
jgi:hypothetical protein